MKSTCRTETQQEVVGIELLLGKTISAIERDEDCIKFVCKTGEKYKMYHEQECCENVTIESIIGDLEDLIDNPVLVAREATNTEEDSSFEHHTWTFYKIATIKGYVDIRWHGSSNSFYSERVSFGEYE